MDELALNSFKYALGHSNFVVKRSLDFISRDGIFNNLKPETIEYMLFTVEARLAEYEEAILEAEMETCFGNKNFVSKKLRDIGGTHIALEWNRFRNFLLTKVRH